MGVALPQGDMKTVYETIKTNEYMGWKSCTMQEAQAAANNGVAAIGISEDRIVVLSAIDEEQPVAQSASVMTLDENTLAFAVNGLQYYSYSYVTTNPCVLVNGWLRLYTRPTVSCGGRIVNIPVVNSFTGSDGYLYQFTNKNYWYSYENPYTNCGYINPYAQNQITALGKTVTVNIGSCGEYTDANGRYWMAVGPNVVNPSHTGGQAITPTEMYGTGVLDIVVKDSSGKKYYIPAVVGDAKAHTWNNGVIQTYKAYPNGNFSSAGRNYNGTVAAEFIGNLKGKLSGLGKYSIDSIIFYAD